MWEAQGSAIHSTSNDTFTLLFCGELFFPNNCITQDIHTCKKWKLSGLLLVLEIQKCSLNFSCSHKLHSEPQQNISLKKSILKVYSITS